MRDGLIDELRNRGSEICRSPFSNDVQLGVLLLEAANELEQMSIREFQNGNRGVFLSNDAASKINDINKDREEKGLSPL